MASRMGWDPYVVLGVGRQASLDEIARAYRRAARASHPDSGGSGERSAESFRAVSDAYDVLRDPGRRAEYDRSHPLAPPRTASAQGGSVGYARAGSQHLVLGRRTPGAAADSRLHVGETDVVRSVRRGEEIEEKFRAALLLLRARW